ncbi:helix-turn-helix domain-containing protein, partial [Bradyrhizobium pachyrhizi]
MGPLSSQTKCNTSLRRCCHGRSYKQLSLDDRCEIACLSANGSSVRQIAAALDRSPSTVSRE